MIKQKTYNKYLAIIILLLLAAALIYFLLPFINAFFGALILFVLFYPLHKLFVEKLKINKSLSAIIVIVITLIIIIIPTIFILNTAYKEISNIDTKYISSKIATFDEMYPNLHIMAKINDNLPNIATWGGNLLIKEIGNIINILLIILIMYFVLYYLLVYNKRIGDTIKEHLPFSKKNSTKLYEEFKNITRTTIFSAGLIAIMQGGLLTLGFLFFGIKGAVLWGIIGAVISFLPVLGLPILYVPFSIIYLVNNNYFVGIGILIWGVIVSLSENFLRPTLQNKMGNIHPLISIIGVIIGIPAFGIVGIIIGPLLITYIILTYKMFMEEYIK